MILPLDKETPTIAAILSSSFFFSVQVVSDAYTTSIVPVPSPATILALSVRYGITNQCRVLMLPETTARNANWACARSRCAKSTTAGKSNLRRSLSAPYCSSTLPHSISAGRDMRQPEGVQGASRARFEHQSPRIDDGAGGGAVAAALPVATPTAPRF